MKRISYKIILLTLGLSVFNSCKKEGNRESELTYSNQSYLVVNPIDGSYDSTINETSSVIEGVDLIEDYKKQDIQNSEDYNFDKIDFTHSSISIDTYNLGGFIDNYIDSIQLIIYNHDRSNSILLATSSDVIQNLTLVNTDLQHFVTTYPDYYLELVTSFSNYPENPIKISYAINFTVNASYKY